MGTDLAPPRIGDTMQTKVRQPYPATISIKLENQAMCEYAAKVLADPESGFTLIRADTSQQEGGKNG